MDTYCRQENCKNIADIRGFCRKHYDHLRRTDPATLRKHKTRIEKTQAERLEEHTCTFEAACKNKKTFRNLCHKHYIMVRQWEITTGKPHPTHPGEKPLNIVRIKCHETGIIYETYRDAAVSNNISYSYMKCYWLWNQGNNIRRIKGYTYERLVNKPIEKDKIWHK